ncbi:SH3 domain-containing protein [Streptomyces sp. NPDC003038]|uniref:SH3 domain-containing protein n=1 Tax=unclassified Streptomyces TaxID=2593676 RepID=UPI00339E323A
MLKPTRTILALAAGSLALGLFGAAAAVADADPVADAPSRKIVDAPSPAELDDDYPNPQFATGKIISRGPLNIREYPNTHSYVFGKAYPNDEVVIECKKHGERVGGNSLWYRLDGEDSIDEGWVAARYVKNLSPVRYCR